MVWVLAATQAWDWCVSTRCGLPWKLTASAFVHLKYMHACLRNPPATCAMRSVAACALSMGLRACIHCKRIRQGLPVVCSVQPIHALWCTCRSRQQAFHAGRQAAMSAVKQRINLPCSQDAQCYGRFSKLSSPVLWFSLHLLHLQQAAQESREEVLRVLQGADMVFVTVSAAGTAAAASAAATARTAAARCGLHVWALSFAYVP